MVSFFLLFDSCTVMTLFVKSWGSGLLRLASLDRLHFRVNSLQPTVCLLQLLLHSFHPGGPVGSAICIQISETIQTALMSISLGFAALFFLFQLTELPTGSLPRKPGPRSGRVREELELAFGIEPGCAGCPDRLPNLLLGIDGSLASAHNQEVYFGSGYERPTMASPNTVRVLKSFQSDG